MFFGRFAQELDRFVAEFESLDGQVGAVVLADGRVLGVERTPTAAYWQTLWAPLLRGCYGAEVIRRQQTGAPARPPATRVPLDATKVGSLEELADAVEAANRAEQRLTHDRIAELERLPLKTDDASPSWTKHGWRPSMVGGLSGSSCAAAAAWCTRRWSRGAGESESQFLEPARRISSDRQR